MGWIELATVLAGIGIALWILLRELDEIKQMLAGNVENAPDEPGADCAEQPDGEFGDSLPAEELAG